MIAFVFGLMSAAILCGLISSAARDIRIDRVLFLIMGIALIIFCGFREVGVDQDSVGYYNYFNLDDYGMSLVAEPSFIYIAKLARAISDDNALTWLFIIYATLGVSLKIIAIQKYSTLPWLALVTYISSYFLLHEFTQIRAGVAAGFVLLSIKPLLDRDPKKFILLIGLASIFHYSALVMAPIYFFPVLRLNFKRKFLIGLAVPVGILFSLFEFDITFFIPIELVRLKVDTYLEVESLRDVQLNVFNLVYLLKYSMLYVFLFFSRVLESNSRYAAIMIQMYAISMFTYLALSFNSAFAIRISELFGVVEIILIPMIYYMIRAKAVAVAIILAIALGNLALSIFQTELIQQV